jgi:hypothetical protein
MPISSKPFGAENGQSAGSDHVGRLVRRTDWSVDAGGFGPFLTAAKACIAMIEY